MLQLDMPRMQVHQAVKRLVQDAIVHALVASVLSSCVRACVARVVAALGVQVWLLTGKQPLHEHCHSVVTEEVFKEPLLLLRLELANRNAVDVRNLDLLGANLDALDVLELSQSSSLSHVLLHLADVFDE